jgi:hypothetical protein
MDTQNTNTPKNSPTTEDLDRELKRIQLQRETLALERELRGRRLHENTLGAAKAGLRRAKAAAPVARNALFVLVAGGCVAGVLGVLLYAVYTTAEKDEARALAAHEAKVQEFVETKCQSTRVPPGACVKWDTYLNRLYDTGECRNQLAAEAACARKARDEFEASQR